MRQHFAARRSKGAATSALADPSPGGTLYPYYTALDMATIPSVYSTYNGIGALALSYPAVPVTTTSASAANNTQFSTALQTGGGVITCTTTFTGGTYDFNILDCHVIINAGVVLRNPNFGNGGRTGARLRISGDGQLHQASFSGTWSDVIIDVAMVTGPSTVNSHAIAINDNPITRLALIGFLGRSGQSFFIGDVYDGVMAGCSIQAGATPGTTGEPAWIYRSSNTGWMVAFQSELRTNRFHPIRSHPNATTARNWTSQCVIVHLEESKAWTVDARMSSHTAVGSYAGFIGNTVYAQTGTLNCSCPVNGGNVVDYGEVTGNTFNLTGASDSSIDLAACTTAVKSGNTYNPTTSAPAWTRDPTSLNIAP
jgi:hypothetical protein